MTPSISGASQASAPTRPTAQLHDKKTAQPVAAPASAKTTASFSQAAQAALAASKEANESPAQTAREAQGNDLQAKRLLAKETAAGAAHG
jgi:hypothetical protein